MTPDSTILLVDDDQPFLDAMAGWLRGQGYSVEAFADAEAAARVVVPGRFALAVLDLVLPELDGISLLERIRSQAPTTEVVVLTGSATVDTAIRALRTGAYDYVTKPVEPERLLSIVRGATEKWRLAEETRELKEQVKLLRSDLEQRHGFHALVGKTPAMKLVFDRIAAARRSRGTVLIRGESGTGKELVARALHFAGASGPFVPVNCAALPHDLIEAELFGHRRGAFTGASQAGDGLFLAADGGTLFLDEVTEMALGVQAKLLRALQEKQVRPVGSSSERAIDVRVIASTNRDPREAVASGKLREDLYYRLSVMTIQLPSLRERRDDIKLLIQHFISKFAETSGQPALEFDGDSMRALLRYNWPGNVRELENAIEQALTYATGPMVTLAELPPEIASAVSIKLPALNLPGVVSLDEAEKLAIEQALLQLDGNKSRAAQALGISRKYLYTRMKALGVKSSGDST